MFGESAPCQAQDLIRADLVYPGCQSRLRLLCRESAKRAALPPPILDDIWGKLRDLPGQHLARCRTPIEIEGRVQDRHVGMAQFLLQGIAIGRRQNALIKACFAQRRDTIRQHCAGAPIDRPCYHVENSHNKLPPRLVNWAKLPGSGRARAGVLARNVTDSRQASPRRCCFDAIAHSVIKAR